MSSSPSTNQSTPSQTFSQASQALAQIVERFRNDTLPLEEALALYETGVSHVRTCQTLLATCRGKVTELTEALAATQASSPLGSLPDTEDEEDPLF